MAEIATRERGGGPAACQGKPSIAVAICTYNRNAELRLLLDSLRRIGRAQAESYALGVVVVDDSPDAAARPVLRALDGAFELGAHYVHSGARNISIARNKAIEAAARIGDWVAMTDDDCEPDDAWLLELLRVQGLRGGQVVTGPLIRRAPAGAPSWIVDQPFLNASRFDATDGARLQTAFTNNCMLSAGMIREHADLRFKSEFGRIGGEDTVFFHEIARSGAEMFFARNAVMYENEVPERLTFAYQIRRFFWYGNTSARTSLKKGVKRGKLLIHGVATMARAFYGPVGRARAGGSPQFRFALAEICGGLGKISGALGLKINHR